MPTACIRLFIVEGRSIDRPRQKRKRRRIEAMNKKEVLTSKADWLRAQNAIDGRAESSAVKAAPFNAYGATYESSKNSILSNSSSSRNFIKIINILDDVDVVRALAILSAATHLFRIKFEEIKKENSK